MNILIVGATSGIGRALYEYYIALGNNVAIMGRRKVLLDELCASNPANTFPLPIDVSDIDAFNAAFKDAIGWLRHIDLVIICAGVGDLNPTLNISLELETIATNVVGWVNAMDAVYHYFESQTCGHIVSFTSVGGLQPTPIAPSYSASKAFQINYTKSLQAKAKKSGIYITEIRPGLVNTRMAKGEGLFWVMPVETVTKQIIRAIAKRRKLCVVTKRWRLINYILKHFI